MAGATVDVVIVGNGVLGLSIAYEAALRDPSLRIVVIGPNARPTAATTAAGAMLNCFAEVTSATDEHPASRAKFAIARDALDAWPAWLERLDDDGDGSASATWLPGTLLLLVARSTSHTTKNFEAVHAALKQYSEPHQELDPQDLDEVRAAPHEPPIRAIYLEREGVVDARAVVASLETAVRRRGLVIRDDTVAGLVEANGRVTGVRLSTGETVAAGAVVLAAGTGTQRCIEHLPAGTVQPLFLGTGFAAETRRQRGAGFGHVVRTALRAGSCGIHVVPLGDRREYIGATSVVHLDPPEGPGLGIAQAMLQFAVDKFDRRLGFSQMLRYHYGHRPVPLDTYPLIGRTPVSGLLFATGTYRDGFHCSPVIARHMATLLTASDTEPGPFDHFLPGRVPIETLDVGAAVARYAEEEASTTIDFGAHTPYFTGVDAGERVYRQAARDALDRLGTPIGLRPEILGAVIDADDHQMAKLSESLRALRERSPERV
ncbi:FAD-binding oxidoreductase [Nocardiopsis gilva]|nr:FAD-dependent oxidoreductase [Nocardiopsis gilva]